MKLMSIACPSCGSPVRIEPDQPLTECPFCGQQLYVDDGTRHVEHQVTYDGSEDAGYMFEKGRMQAQRDAKWLEGFRNGDASDAPSDTKSSRGPDGTVTPAGAAKSKTVTMRGIVVVIVCIVACAALLRGLPRLFSRLRLPGASVASPVVTDVDSKMESSFTHVGYVDPDAAEWDYDITEDDFIEEDGEVLDEDESEYYVGATAGSGAYTCLITNLTGEATPEFEVIRWNDAHDDCVRVGTLHLEPHEQVQAEFPDDSEELCVTYASGVHLGIKDVFMDGAPVAEDSDDDWDEDYEEDDSEGYEENDGEDYDEESSAVTTMLDEVETPSDSFADLDGIECWIAGKQYKEFKYTMQNYLLMDFPVMEMPELRNIPIDKGWKISATKTEESEEHGSRKYSIVVTGPSRTPPKSVSREYVFTFAKNADSDAGIPESTER